MAGGRAGEWRLRLRFRTPGRRHFAVQANAILPSIQLLVPPVTAAPHSLRFGLTLSNSGHHSRCSHPLTAVPYLPLGP